MKGEKILTLIVLSILILPIYSNGQTKKLSNQKGSISGKVIETSSSAALEFATVSIFSKLDSTVISGTITENDGSFRLEVPFGSYFTKIEFIGLTGKMIDNITIDKSHQSVNLGNIQLEAKAENLNEVTITAEKDLEQISLDKRIYNVGKDLANAGGSAIDVLDNLPSVAVELGGTLTLRGSRGVQILIDGKPSGLVSNGNTSGLQSLSADMIERVEIITNPSVKYEAEGTAGIINIVLKKEKKRGVNGSGSLSAALPKVINATLSLNHKTEKINLFGNFSFNDYINLGTGAALQIASLDDGTTDIFQSNSIYNAGGPSGNFRIGSDFNFDKNTVLTVTATSFISNEDHYSEIKYDNFLDDLTNPLGSSTRIENRLLSTRRNEVSTIFTKKFGKNQQEIAADLRYNQNSSHSNSDFTETFFQVNQQPANTDDLLQQSFFQNDERRFIAKLDYTLPLSDDDKFEMGWQSSFRTISNAYAFEEYLLEKWIIAEDFTNTFDYDEKIHAAYALYKNVINQLAVQVGLRSEYSFANTSLAADNQKKYLNFFPSFHISYELPNNNTLQASYSRRIKRPRSMSLNPYIAFDDNRAFFSGNPELNPEITDVYEIGHVKKWEKGSLGSFIFYRHTTDVIEGILRETTIDGIPVFFRQPANLNSKDDIGFEFNISYRPVKWWKINSDFYIFRASIDGSNINDEISLKTYTGFGRLTSRVTLFEDLDVQLRLNYRAPLNIPQGRRLSMTYLDAGISKKILKEKGKLTLNVSDVFTSRRIQIDFAIENLVRENDYLWNRTRIRLTLNYRIGN